MPPSPRKLGFRMPAEWEPHEATWLAWPHERSDWPGKFEPVEWVYCEVVRKLVRHEKVHILVGDGAAEQRARSRLRKAGVEMAGVEFFRCPTDRSWTRDYCPLFIRNRAGEVAATNWLFNGWAKYGNWRKDHASAGRLTRRLKMREWRPGLVLEGGAIDVNGRGMLLATEECLLSPVQARNPGVSRSEMEKALREHLGAVTVIWLAGGIAGDDTHGHVDDVARFVDASTVVACVDGDKGEPHYEALRENLRRLRRVPLRVAKLPMPEPIFFDGQRLPASYANFYIANRQVLVPTFNDPKDRIALNTLARAFPSREVAGIHCTDLALGLGTLHCMTQQQPAGRICPA